MFAPPTHDHDLEIFLTNKQILQGGLRKQISSKVLSVVDELQMWFRYLEDHHDYKIVKGPGFIRAEGEFDFLEILWSPK